MTLKTYNGFNHYQRMRALRWLNGEYAAGRRIRPTACDVCSQTEGVIQAHSENYGEPFGPHIGEHSLCYCCHMMIHKRFTRPDKWAEYKRHMREGWTYRAQRGYPGFIHGVLEAQEPKMRLGEPRGRTMLDDLK